MKEPRCGRPPRCSPRRCAVAVVDAGRPGTAAAVDSVRLVRSLSADGLRNVARRWPASPGSYREHVLVNGGGEYARRGADPGVRRPLGRSGADGRAGGRRGVVLAHVGRAERPGPRCRGGARRRRRTDRARVDDRVRAPGGARALGIVRPIQEYPLFEQALRHSLGVTPAEHQSHLGRLGAVIQRGRGGEPVRVDCTAHTADETAPPRLADRLVGLPYTKLMVSNELVDTAVALLVTTVGVARELGIAEERWVYPLAAASGAATHLRTRRARRLRARP